MFSPFIFPQFPLHKEAFRKYAASHKEVKDIAVGTGVSGHAGSDSFRESLSIFQGMRICPT